MLSSREKDFTLFAPKCMGGGGYSVNNFLSSNPTDATYQNW